MSSTWLSNVANLLVFFRWTTVWLNVVLLGISLLPFTILAICIFSVTGIAAIYNITVCIVQHKEKKRSSDGTFPVPSLAVIILDYIFAFLFLAAWILATFFVGYGYYSYRYYYGYAILRNYTSVGCLVAWHYHLFFAAVSTHIRRRQGQGLIIPHSNNHAVVKSAGLA